MLLIGFGMLVFGGMFPGLTFFVLTMIIVGVGLISLMYLYLIPTLFPAWSVWIAFYFSFGMGAGLGVGATKWPHIGILLLGATVGAGLGEMIDLLIIQQFVDQYSLANKITIGVMVLVTMILSLFLFDHVVIISSCTIGSYLFVRVSYLILFDEFRQSVFTLADSAVRPCSKWLLKPTNFQDSLGLFGYISQSW